MGISFLKRKKRPDQECLATATPAHQDLAAIAPPHHTCEPFGTEYYDDLTYGDDFLRDEDHFQPDSPAMANYKIDAIRLDQTLHVACLRLKSEGFSVQESRDILGRTWRIHQKKSKSYLTSISALPDLFVQKLSKDWEDMGVRPPWEE